MTMRGARNAVSKVAATLAAALGSPLASPAQAIASMAAVKAYHPTTFQERGVSVPFTTPLLGGARMRKSRRDNDVEVVVNSPAGGRGTYVMPWRGVGAFCQPTLHDKVLSIRLAVLPALTPAAVRDAARLTAAEGLAGEDAMLAAIEAAATDEAERRIARHQILLALVKQVRAASGSSSQPLAPDSPELDDAARRTAVSLGRHLGQPAHWTVTAVNGIADGMADLGVTIGGGAGRVPRVMALLTRVGTLLTRVGTEIGDWGSTRSGSPDGLSARLVHDAIKVTLALTGAVLARALAQTDDMIAMLRLWSSDQEQVVRVIGRAEWLLDGWEPICRIWCHASDEPGRRAAVAEIVDLVPVPPREAAEWHGIKTDLEQAFRTPPPRRLNEDWRTGARVLDLTARNERFRALSA